VSSDDTPVKILLVDDRSENLLALEAILAGLGHELVKAASGEEALKRLLTEDVAVILLDVQMPGMDGFETAAHVKRRERTRDIPIVFLTGHRRRGAPGLPRLRGRRGRLPVEALRPLGAAREGGGVRRAAPARRQLEAQTARLQAEAALVSSGRLHDLVEEVGGRLRGLQTVLARDAGDRADQALEQVVAVVDEIERMLPARDGAAP
jgi:CheY-like chemotaxis protein